MHRTVLFCVTVISLGFLVSCSGSGSVTQKAGQSQRSSKMQKYPTWYSDNPVVNTDTVMYAYATAIDGDSASAVGKAVAWAKSEMQSSLSDKLENIRLDAIKKENSDSRLDQSDFLLALRKADNVVNDLAKTGHTKVKMVKGYNSYRSFAEIRVPKSKLIEGIGQRLSKYREAWSAMRDSNAFKSF